MQRVVPQAVYALASWTVKKDGDKFRISRTAYFEEKSRDWSKSYASLTQATNAIARKLQEEWTTRHQRRSEFNGSKRRRK